MLDSAIQEMFPTPSIPLEAPSIDDWKDIEGKYADFPTDFKEFIGQYGTGCIGGFIYLFNPASRNANLNLSEQIEKQLRALREARPIGLKLFPEEAGILPFGITDNGDLLAWKVHSKHTISAVVVVDSRASKWEEFELGFSQFLVRLLEQDIVCSIFPDDFPNDAPAFAGI